MRLLGIYLDDHLAVVVGARELVKRMLGETQDEEISSFLHELVREIDRTERELTGVLDELGRQPSRTKRAAAWTAEKAGRAKFNGSLTGYSPLTRLVELEYLGSALTLERACWRALDDAVPELAEPDGLFGSEAERVERRIADADELRRAAVEVALAERSVRRL
jgi:hypothetical protein